MAQAPLSKLSRQQKRAIERQAIRKTMSKPERRTYHRMSRSLKKEIYRSTLEMLADKRNY